MAPIQYVTLVAAGGTPVRLADVNGTPYPTTGTGALVFANNPSLTNPIITGMTFSGTFVATAFSSTSPPSINGIVGGQNSYMTEFLNVTGSRDGSSGWQNEYGLSVIMTNAAGAANPAQAGKAAINATIVATSAAGQSTAFGAVTTLNSGFSTATVNALVSEFDFNNNSGVNATDGDPHALGVWNGYLLLTGAGTNQINFGLNVGGNNTIRNGIIFSAGGPIATDMRSYSSSIIFLQDSGSHTHGLYASTAAYSGSFITGPSGNFQVLSSGNTGIGAASLGNVRLYIKGAGTGVNYGIFVQNSVGGTTFSTQDNGAVFIGAATATSLANSSSPSISFNWLNTVSSLATLSQSGAAASNTLPEFGASIYMPSATGFANHATAYKQGLGIFLLEATTGTSADLYGVNAVVQGHAGTGGILLTAGEFNVNNNGVAATTLGAATAAYGAVAAPGGSAIATAGFFTSGVNQGFQYGFAINNVIGGAGFYDTSNSPTVLGGTGTHTNGVDFTGMALTTAFKSTGFNVSGSGVTSIGTTTAPSAGVAYIHVGTNQNLQIRAGITVGAAIALNAVNDAQAANVPLEINASTLTIDPATTISGALTLSSALTYGGVTLSSSVTGTGGMVLSTSPTLTTPNIGAATGTSLAATGAVTAFSGTVIPAGGTAGSGYLLSATANFGLFFGSGAPTLSAVQGSLYARSNGVPYFNVAGSTGWAPVSTTTATAVGTATYTVIDSDTDLVFSVASTVTLPSAATYANRALWVLTTGANAVTSAAANVVPITGGGAATAVLAATAGKWAKLVSNGTNWQIMAAN